MGDMNIAGARIQMARENMRLNQDDLIAKLGFEGLVISQTQLSKIENGHKIIKDKDLKIFKKVLGVSSDWLLGD